MDSSTHDKVLLYVRNQLAQADKRLYSYAVDKNGKSYIKRSGALVLEKYIRDYQTKGSEPRWVAMPGLRGVGKTTLLAQIYTQLKCEQNHKLYVSLDEATRILGVTLHDILSVYEELIGEVFENLEKPVYLFLDEVQYEENWALVLKSIYDRSNKVFILCTGSAALLLQTNPDVSRRMAFEKLYPLSFSEYMMIRDRRFPVQGLARIIRDAILTAESGQMLLGKLRELQASVNSYWLGVNRLAIDGYLRYGTLPFTLQFNSEPLMYDQIEQSLTNVVNTDIPKINTFDSLTIAKIDKILYAVASSDVLSLKKLSEMFSISINTLISILDTCAKAELLLRVYPYGTHYGQVRKPSKYLFLSSAYRSMFYNLIGSAIPYESYKGQLLEDVVGLYLYRILGSEIGTALTYDSVEGGADFIISLRGKRIVLEVGYGNKRFRQIEQTLRRIDGDYGILVSSSRLSTSEDKKIVSVPIEYFLLT